MNQELARKRPANAVRRIEPQRKPNPPIVPAGKAVIQFASRERANRKLAALHAEGRILPEWTVRQGRSGNWTADVTFINVPARHRKPTNWLKVWAVGMVSVLALLTGYVVAKALALAVAAVVPFIVAGAFIFAAVGLFAGHKVVHIHQNVNVR